MAFLSVLLYFLIMRHFDGIEWVNFNHSPRLVAWKDTRFPDYYVIDYCHSGFIRWGMGHEKLRTLHAPVAWWTFPGPHFTFGSDNGAPWDHYFVGFRGPRARQFLKTGLFPIHADPPYLNIQSPERFRDAFEALLQSLNSLDHGSARSVHLLEGLLLLLSEQTRESTPMDSPAARIRQAMASIWKAPSEPWDFKAFAENISLSYSHFRKLFREVAGLPPQHFLLKARIDSAAVLLRNTTMGIKTVSEQTGFDDLYHFSKLFKKQYHLPPGEYRCKSRLF